MDDLSALIIEGLTLEVWGESARACGSPQFRIAPEGSLAGGGGELWYPSDGL